MRRILRFVLAALVLAGCGSGGGNSQNGEFSVFVSIEPLRFFAEAIGGDRAGVVTLVARGQSPATYEPTAKQLAALAGSDLFFTVGVPMEKTVVPRIRSGFEPCATRSPDPGRSSSSTSGGTER